MKSAGLFKKAIALTMSTSMLLGSGGYTKAFAGTEQNTVSANNTASVVDADTYESGANAVTTSVPAGKRTYFPAQFLDFDMNKINAETLKMVATALKRDGNESKFNNGGNKNTKYLRENYPALIFHEASNVGHDEYGDVKVKADDYDVNNQGAFCSWYNRSNCGNINWDYYGPLDPTSYQGLVSNTLVDDLPLFNAYVANPFDASLTADGRDIHQNVQVQFEADENGYYVLDSDKYDYVYKKNTNSVDINGAGYRTFFPLDGHHHYSMNLGVDFTMNEDGTYNGKNCEFNFSGDDDVWVFIDGKLAIDLGGVHSKCGAKIDFHDKKVTYECKRFVPGGSTGSTGRYIGNDEEAVSFENLGLDVCDNGTHRLQVFYLERGGSASNCKITFNMPTINENEDIKGDYTLTKKTVGDAAVEGAGFTIYDKDDQQIGNEIFSDKDGKVTFKDLATGIYTIKETTVPEGYIGNGKTYTLIASGNANKILNFALKDQDGNYITDNVIYNNKESDTIVTIDKQSKLDNWTNRTYNVSLSANAQQETSEIIAFGEPADVVLVLDASNSMKFASGLTPCTYKNSEGLDTNKEYYFVTEDTKATVYNAFYNNGRWMYVASDRTGNDKYEKAEVLGINEAYRYGVKQYTYSYKEYDQSHEIHQFYEWDGKSRRIDQVKYSAIKFVEQLASISEESRVGLVWFNSNAGTLLDGQMVQLNAEGVRKVENEILNLDRILGSGTNQKSGMDEALKLVESIKQKAAVQDGEEGKTAVVEEEKDTPSSEDTTTSDDTTISEDTITSDDTNASENATVEEDTAASEETVNNAEDVELPENVQKAEDNDVESAENTTDDTENVAAGEQTEQEEVTETPSATEEEKEDKVEDATNDNIKNNVKDEASSENNKKNSDENADQDADKLADVNENADDKIAENALDDDRNTCVVLLTDGCPTVSGVSDMNAENGSATTLRNMDKVTLVTVGIDIDNGYMTEAAELLEETASVGKDGSKLTFNDKSENLDAVFVEIAKVIYNTDEKVTYKYGNVIDYIDPRFEVIDTAGGVLESDDKGVYIKWDNQLLQNWNRVIKIRAIDSYVGGNNIDTNGAGSGVTVEDNFYEFNRPKVNVRINISAGETEDTIFLGQDLNRYFTKDQQNKIFALNEQGRPADGRDYSDVDLSFSLLDEKGNVMNQFDHVGLDAIYKYIQIRSPETETVYQIKVSATPKVADNSEEAKNAAESMKNADGVRYTASMKDAGDAGATSMDVFGKYTVHIIDGTLTISKAFDKEFLRNLPYSEEEKQLIEAQQTAVFTVNRYAEDVSADNIKNGSATPIESFKISITGNDSQTVVNMRAGMYQIVEDKGWSWKYKLNGYKENVKTGDNKNNFDKNDFSADDGIFYLGKNRDGVHRDETFATAKVDVTNQMKTDKKWFADTTNVLNVFKNDATIQSANSENGSVVVSGNNVDARAETTTEEKLNTESKNKTNASNYSQNGEPGGYHTDGN